MEDGDFGMAANKIYDFAWSEFCDWYIELSKGRLMGEDEEQKRNVRGVLLYVLEGLLKLLHPFMPFLTEEVYQHLPEHDGMLILARWPEVKAEYAFETEERQMEGLMEIIRAIRNLRAEMNVQAGRRTHVTLIPDAGWESTLAIAEPYLQRLAYASDVAIVPADQAPAAAGMVAVVTHAAQMFIPLGELVDLEKEKARLEKELKKNTAELQKLNTKLQNPGFVNKAPANVVEAERERSVKLAELVAKLEEQLKGM